MDKIDDIGCSVAVALLKVLNGLLTLFNRFLLKVGKR
jgi:hypothetical protein